MTMVSVVSALEVVFSNQSGSYFEGDLVHGHVVVDLKEDIVIENLQIIFRGTAVVQWPEDIGGGATVLNSQRRRRRRRGSRLNAEEATTDEEQYLNQMICLYARENNPQSGILVAAGKHSYPFTIQLPDVLPSSFRGDYGYLTYTATAVLERPFLSQIVVSKDFTVSSVVDLNQDVVRPVHAVDRESLGLCCFETGHVVCDWRLERRGFIPGDEIVINGEIHNNCNLRITRSKASLVQHTRYQGSSSGNAVYQRKQMTKLEKSEVPPGTIGFWRERMTVPPNLPQTGLKGCNIISLSYTLKLKVFLAMHNPIETVIDIVIGTNAIRSPILRSFTRLSASTDSSRNESVLEPDMTYFI